MKSDDTGCGPGFFGAAGKSIAAGAGIFAEKQTRSKLPFKRTAPPLQEGTAQ